LFIQLTANSKRDVPIPGELFSFGVLASAQATGDLAALHAHGRRVIRIDLGSSPAAGLRQLTQSIGGATAQSRERTTRRTESRHRGAPKRRATRRRTRGARRNKPR